MKCHSHSPIIKFDVGPVTCDLEPGHIGKHCAYNADGPGPPWGWYHRYWSEEDCKRDRPGMSHDDS